MPSEKVVDKKIFGTERSVVVLGIARMADSVGSSFLIVVLPLYIASNHISGSDYGFSVSLITGIILGAFGIISSISQPIAGHLSDRVGKRKYFAILGLAIFAIANASYILADSYITMLLVRALQGLAAAFTITASVALVSEMSRNENRGNNMGVYNTLRLVGFGVGPLASGVLIESGPYQLPFIGEIDGFIAAFCIASAAALISLFLVSWLVKDPEVTKASKKSIVIRILSKQKGKFLDPIFALGLASLIMSFGFSILAPIETETNLRLSQGPFMFSVEFSAMIASMAIFQPFIGKASDKYGRRIFIIIGLCSLVPVTLVQGLATQPWHLIVARSLQGISAAMVLAPSLALAGDMTDKGQTGSQLSVLTMAFGLGVSIGSMVAGYLVGFGYIVPFIAGSVLAVIAAFIVITQVPKEKKNIS